MQKGVIVFGICNLTKGVLDILQKNHLIVYGILEDDPKWHHRELCNIPILGPTRNVDILKLLNEECAFFIGYQNMAKRQECLKLLTAQSTPSSIAVIHPSAIIMDCLQSGHGNYIGAQVCVAAESTLGNYCILHNSVTIESQTHIDDWVEIGAGSVIGEKVTLEKEVCIGIGARVVAGVTVGRGAYVGPGAVVLDNVKQGDRVWGNPAKAIH